MSLELVEHSEQKGIHTGPASLASASAQESSLQRAGQVAQEQLSSRITQCACPSSSPRKQHICSTWFEASDQLCSLLGSGGAGGRLSGWATARKQGEVGRHRRRAGTPEWAFPCYLLDYVRGADAAGMQQEGSPSQPAGGDGALGMLRWPLWPSACLADDEAAPSNLWLTLVATALTPRVRKPPRSRQRSAHASAAGHGGCLHQPQSRPGGRRPPPRRRPPRNRAPKPPAECSRWGGAQQQREGAEMCGQHQRAHA